jgi:hypothetical protein
MWTNGLQEIANWDYKMNNPLLDFDKKKVKRVNKSRVTNSISKP